VNTQLIAHKPDGLQLQEDCPNRNERLGMKSPPSVNWLADQSGGGGGGRSLTHYGNYR